MAAHKQVSGVWKEGRASKSPPSARAFAAQKNTREWKNNGRKVTTAYPHRRRPIQHGFPTRTASGTCDGSSIRVLYVGDANGGWCGFAGAGNIVTIVVERVKRSRCEEVDGVSSNGLSMIKKGHWSIR